MPWISAVSLAQILSVLLLAVILSGYERRSMAAVHRRDGPTYHLILGMGQPVVEGAKLLLKSTTRPSPPLLFA